MSDDNGGFWRPVGVGRVTDEGLDELARQVGHARTCGWIDPDVILGLIEEVRAARAEIARLRAAGDRLAGSVRGSSSILFGVGGATMMAQDQTQWEALIDKARAIMDRVAAALAAWDAAAGPGGGSDEGGPP